MKMLLNPRLLWADSLKGWLMLLVILGHAIQTVMPETCFQNHIWNLIYSFHMPAFMAVSGYFAYRANRYGGQISVLEKISSTYDTIYCLVYNKLFSYR